MRTRKRFGQHFLHDPAVIDRILVAIDPKPGQHLVEIGPGPGTLTRPLLEHAGALEAVEIDRDLAATLQAELGPRGLTLHVGDALRFDWAALAARLGGKLRLVGNLPYNISTPLLFALLEQAEHIDEMVFMMQKEVIDRIVAAPGSDQYGRLGVMLAPRVHSEHLFDVGPGAFRPPPRVWSSVLRMTPSTSPPDWALTPRYAEVVSAAFSQRRKTLRNALSRWVGAADIEAIGLDPGIRAETLPPEAFGRLAQQSLAVLH
ncbi:MAG: 16S rRNA (adenine(1518)-N(6)/adenine(1519)-N(6))-dimethyltransferase RsmA [Steroidobacteraceae bacterium]